MAGGRPPPAGVAAGARDGAVGEHPAGAATKSAGVARCAAVIGGGRSRSGGDPRGGKGAGRATAGAVSVSARARVVVHTASARSIHSNSVALTLIGLLRAKKDELQAEAALARARLDAVLAAQQGGRSPRTPLRPTAVTLPLDEDGDGSFMAAAGAAPGQALESRAYSPPVESPDGPTRFLAGGGGNHYKR